MGVHVNSNSGWASYDKNRDGLDSDRSPRVVGIGAICDFASGAPEPGPSLSFSIHEFVELEDGRWVALTSDRGFTVSSVRKIVELEDGQRVVLENVAPYRSGLTPERIRQDVLNVVLPDEGDESGEAHPWEWLAERARIQGLAVTADELKMLDYRVVLTRRLFEWLTIS